MSKTVTSIIFKFFRFILSIMATNVIRMTDLSSEMQMKLFLLNFNGLETNEKQDDLEISET